MSLESETPLFSEPFAAEPAQLSGCGKPAIIGCLVVLIVFAAGLFLLMWKAQDLLQFAIEEYRDAVVESLPDEITLEERQRLDAAFDGAIKAIEAGDLDPAGLQGLQRALASPPRLGETLSRETVLDLTLALEAIAGANGGDERSPDQLETPARAPVVATVSW
jgi:hypothetical protein